MEAEQGCTGRAFSSTCSELHHYLRGRVTMFEKEAKEYLKKDGTKAEQILDMLNEISPLKITLKQAPFILAMIQQVFKDGAEFGYNKANEWHEIESKVTPKREISKQYMPKNKEKVLLKYHFSGDNEIHISDGYYDAYDFEFHIANNPKFRIVCVIAWKEITLPKEIKEND